ncbi:MAG: glycosyltransferase (group 1) [Candidatus Saganbacteria bacterium]|uniref:Glycosyltransferase (Group 1) n=1 Tax=Candidatus Saganbacteria bacterium TaxID=2575572 RepID=A0A833KZN8_UNCSA|nr:MAG: glycosyltransferase (group 1) [Candidatus Saganbacteria bacterium]
MNICMLCRCFPTISSGGFEDHVFELCKGLVSQGIGTTLITSKHPNGIEYEEIKGIKIHYLKKSKTGLYHDGYWPESAKKTVELHSGCQFTLIHSQSIAGYEVAKNKIPNKLNIPFIASMHGTQIDEIFTQFNLAQEFPFAALKHLNEALGKFDTFIRREKPTITSANAVIATSNEQAELIKNYYSIGSDKIFKIYNGMNLSQFAPGPKPQELIKKFNITPGKRIILAAARLEAEKGIQHIIKALKFINEDVKLLVLGDGSYRKSLENLAKKLGLNDKVVFLGFVSLDDLPKYFNLCDVFVNPTIRQNGYDLTTLESMACERPTIATNIGSHPTLIQNGNNGLLFTKGNDKELAGCVIKLLNDNALSERIGKSARKRVLEDFSVEKMVENTIKVYENLLLRKNNASKI